MYFFLHLLESKYVLELFQKEDFMKILRSGEFDALNTWGIKGRVLQTYSSYNNRNSNRIGTQPIDLNSVRLTVEVHCAEDDNDKKALYNREEVIQIIAFHRNPHPLSYRKMPVVQNAFMVEEEKPFGTSSEPPLTEEQLAIIKSVVAKLKS